MNDADIEMAELTRAGNDLAAGICPACDDALDPLAPRWEGQTWPRTRYADGSWRYAPTTAAEYAACVGPESAEIPGYHAWCVEPAD